MHRLEYFVSRWLLPALHDRGPLGRDAAAVLRPRRVMEAVQWMDVAVDSGLFSAQAADQAIQTHAAPFFDALISTSPSSRWAMRTGQVEIAHSGLSRELMPDLPPRGRALLKKAMRREPLFPGGLRRESLAGARSFVESLMPLYGTLAVSAPCQWLTHLLRFAPDPQWTATWQAGCTTGEVARYQLDPAAPAGPCALAYAGLLDFSGFAAQCRQRWDTAEITAEGTHDACRRTEPQPHSSDGPLQAALRLRDRVRGILAWRFNLRNPVAQQRLALLYQRVAADIHDEWKRVSADGAHAEPILRTMAEAFETIGIVLPQVGKELLPIRPRQAVVIELPRPNAAIVRSARSRPSRSRTNDRDRSSACLVSL